MMNHYLDFIMIFMMILLVMFGCSNDQKTVKATNIMIYGGSITESDDNWENEDSVIGRVNQYLKVADGKYSLHNSEGRLSIAIKFEMIKMLKWENVNFYDIEMMPLDTSGASIPDIDNIFEIDGTDSDRMAEFLKSQVGSTIVVNFVYTGSDPDERRRVLKNMQGFELKFSDFSVDTPIKQTDELSKSSSESSDENTETEPESSSSDNSSIDEWLDSYEDVVVAYEKAGSNISVETLMEINEKLAELNEKQNEGDMTPAQLTRLTKLVNRLTKVIQRMQ